ncbi:MAG: polysaccharide deacetylase family protein, partial [Nanobdellota archaeon]
MLMKIKGFAAFLLEYTGVNALGFYLQKKIYSNNFIRVINYHDTPAKHSKNLELQLKYFSKYYSPVTLEDLRKFFKTKQWHKDKPGLIISFDDGIKSNFDAALPLVEKYGFTAWFFVCPGVINAKDKANFAKLHSINALNPATPTWAELKTVAKNHVVGAHTLNHKRLGKLTKIELKHEIGERILEQKLGKTNCFAWVGGEFNSYSKQASREIANAGFEFIFQTNSYPITKNTKKHLIQRTNIECSYPLYLVKFQLSGVMDILYWPKRK